MVERTRSLDTPIANKPEMKPTKRAGVTLRSGGHHNPNPIRHGGMGQAERAFSAASTFLSGVMAISASQFIGAPLKFVDLKLYEAYMAWTKESFAVLVTTITQWWAPTIVRVSGDASMKGQLFLMADGTLKCNFPHRLILMGNHQLYTDWLYLWWIAYTNKMHGHIFIILKESLKRLPIVGWGMQFYNFIFLSRKWEHDRYKFKRHLDNLKNPRDPMWLLIFPEGTNLSAATREKSAKWAEKTAIPDMKHQLLPRSTGLQFCLSELRPSTNWLYDCTIAYEVIPVGMYGQDIFTLKSSFFEGRPPKSVNMYFRRFKIVDIPYEDEQQVSRWLLNRWREKDYILEYFHTFGNFPSEDPRQAMLAAEGRKEPNHAKAISTSVKAGGWEEFLGIFEPITTATEALSGLDVSEPLNLDAMLRQLAQCQQPNPLQPSVKVLATTSKDTTRKALLAAEKQSPLPKNVLNDLLRTIPSTQAQIKQELQGPGGIEMGRKAAKDPLSETSISKELRTDFATTLANAIKVAPQVHGNSLAPRAPREAVRSKVPLASVESMITRPISTLAVHTAGQQVKNRATRRFQRNKAALSGQSGVVRSKRPD